MNKLHNIIPNILSVGIVILISGCGGGGGSSAPDQNSNTTNAVQSESAITAHENNLDSIPFDIPPLDSYTKQVYLDAINNARSVSQDCGVYGIKDAVPPLTWNDALYKAAAEHSEDLAESNTFSHTGSYTESDWTAQVMELSSGSSMTNRIENNGYKNWKKIGENIAAGSKMENVHEAINAWLNSDQHCANLMNPEYKNIGIGHYEKDTSDYIHYWTQNFGYQ